MWDEPPQTKNGHTVLLNRTIKDATVKRFHYETRDHLDTFVAAYNFGRRLKTFKGLTLYGSPHPVGACQTAPRDADREPARAGGCDCRGDCGFASPTLRCRFPQQAAQEGHPDDAACLPGAVEDRWTPGRFARARPRRGLGQAH